MSGPSSAPGFYPDPSGSGGRRWWNGERWTTHVEQGPPGGIVIKVVLGIVVGGLALFAGCTALVLTGADEAEQALREAKREFERKNGPLRVDDLLVQRGRVGDPLTLTPGGLRLRVTVRRVRDPLAVGRADRRAARGRRFVGVEVVLENAPGAEEPYAGVPGEEATVVTTGDRQGRVADPRRGDCRAADLADKADIPPGSARRGCLPFTVARGARVREVQYRVYARDGTAATARWRMP